LAEQNSDNKNFNKEESPIPIPPADQAWQAMRQKLDVALPVGKNLPARTHVRRLWIKAAVTATTVATITTAAWQYSHRHNGGTLSSGNNTYDTSLTSTKPVSPATSAATYPSITSKQGDTLPGDTTSSSIKGLSGEQPDVVNSHLLSTSSQSLQTSSSSPAPSSLQSPAPLRPVRKSQPSQATPSTRSPQLLPISVLTQSRQSSDTSQSAQLQQLLQASASGEPLPVEKTPSQPATEQQTFSKQQQLPAKTYTHAGDGPTAKTESHPSLQLAMIQSPVVRYNTSLQRKADLLTLRQLSDRNTEKKWALYLQLNVPVPLSGDSSYFMGPDGKDQFYRYLIPTVRVERKVWKGALSLDVQPSVSTVPTSNKYEINPVQTSPYDTSASLLKQSGWGLALQYQIPVRKKWQVGAGVQASFLQKAVMQQTISDSMSYKYTKIYSASTEDKRDLNKIRLYGTAELDYVAGKWQLGLRTLIPFTQVSKTRDISARPVNVEFVLRRKLWTK
jgi:hypothetical protein